MRIVGGPELVGSFRLTVVLFAGFHEVFPPSIVRAGTNTFPAAEVPDGRVTPEALQHDADLLLGSELAAGYTFDIPDELLGLCGPGFCLPEPVATFASGIPIAPGRRRVGGTAYLSESRPPAISGSGIPDSTKILGTTKKRGQESLII